MTDTSAHATYTIRNRHDKSPIYTASLPEYLVGANEHTRQRYAVEAAVGVGANLASASLTHANLAGAGIAHANLAGANLDCANLARANLARANLAGASLTYVSLAGANLARADLRDAKLVGVNFSRADLRYANLTNADLTSANIVNANLYGVVFARTIIDDGITVNRPPVQITGLYYPVTIWTDHMQIGCEFHSLEDWRVFDDQRSIEQEQALLAMDGRAALKFWRAHGRVLLSLAESDGRGRSEFKETNNDC